MARSCSYKVDDTITRDYMCFREFNINTNKPSIRQIIIIEDDKEPYTVAEKIQFLKDLKSMGFEFTYRYYKDKEELWIDTARMASQRYVKTLFGMYIRYLWEGYGKLGECYGQTDYDAFYKIIPWYNQFKKAYPNENKFVLLNMVSTIFGVYGRFNSNHFPCHRGCIISPKLKEIPKIKLETLKAVSPTMSTVKSINFIKTILGKTFDGEMTAEQITQLYKSFKRRE